MRFLITHRFQRDFDRLSASEKKQFREAIRAFSQACDRLISERQPSWPASLRVKAVQSAPGIWEMTWSFAGPDGRATWEWATIEVDEGNGKVSVPAIRWRRIGNHRIFAEP